MERGSSRSRSLRLSAFPTSTRFEMEPDEQQVEVRILACGPDRVDDVAQLTVVEGTAAIREASWLLQVNGLGLESYDLLRFVAVLHHMDLDRAPSNAPTVRCRPSSAWRGRASG